MTELPPEPEPRSSPTFVDSENEDTIAINEDDPPVDWYTYPSFPEKVALNVSSIIHEGWGAPGGVWGEAN